MSQDQLHLPPCSIQPSEDPLAIPASEGTVREAVTHPSRYYGTAVQRQNRGPEEPRVEYLKYKISHLGAPITVLRENVYLPEPLSV